MTKRKPITMNKTTMANAIDLANKTSAAAHLCAIEYEAGNKAEAQAMAFKAIILLGQDARALNKRKRND